MKKVILSVLLVSVVSFAGSFKLGNTYFNENGTHHFATKVYSKKYAKPNNAKLITSYRERYNSSLVKLKSVKNKIIVSN